jgi:hypothetical protein
VKRRIDRSVGNPRRAFLQRTLAGSVAILLARASDAQDAPLAAAPAKTSGNTAPPVLRVLTTAEARTLATVGDILVPGSAAAGLVAYVDAQLAAPAGRSMLMGRYVGVTEPLGFYRAGLEAIDAAVRREHGHDVDALEHDRLRAFAARLAAGTLADWQGPPAGFVYFVLRTDAIDVTYGTPEGFAKLGVPYMAHIAPPDGWTA